MVDLRLAIVTERDQSPGGSDETAQPRRGWRDDPIRSVDEDLLGRAPFAERAARLIAENHSPETSVVYGIEGPWGCGKSSVVAMTEKFLKSHGKNWKIVHFTPWATSGTEGLLAEFFAALSAVAPKAEGASRLRDGIVRYADIARPIAAVIPVVGDGLSQAVEVARDRARKPWNEAFDEVAQALRELGAPVLVVVDDIDRLQAAELLDLLRVVRLLGRFPGVDFLLAYDEQTLIETLQDPARGHVSKARGRAFLEKIVQLPLSVPALLVGKIVKLLSAGLTEILAEERAAAFESHRFSDMILITMPAQLTTPRAIERFLAQVREQFLAHDRDEINDVDLILSTFLRVQFPGLFGKLQGWKTELTTGSVLHRGVGRRDGGGPNWEHLLGAVDDEDDRRDARAVLETLFPVVGGAKATSERPRRFAHHDYFDRYLAQAIPEGDIPDFTIARALSQAAAGDDAELCSLLTGEDESFALALAKIRSRYPHAGSRSQLDAAQQSPATLDLLSAGMRILGQLKDRAGALLPLLPQVTHWMADVLRLILDANPQADVDTALAACRDATRRAYVLSTAMNERDDVEGGSPQGVQEALRRELRRLVPILLDHLRRGDDADDDLGGSFLYTLISESDTLGDLKKQISEGLARDDFTLGDIAARLVSFSYLVGGSGDPWSATFAGDLFTTLTGVDARSASRERQQWTDTSWARRREFAMKCIEALPDQTRRDE